MLKKIEFIFILFVIFISFIVVFLSKNYFGNIRPNSYFSQNFVDGEILEVIDEKIEEDPFLEGRFIGFQNVRVRILEGELENQVYVLNNTLSKRHNVQVKKGSKIILTIRKDEKGSKVWIYNYKRSNYIHVLVFLFFLSIIVLGGIKGLKSILSLIFTLLMILYVLIPLIFSGYNPIPAALLISSIIIFVCFFLVGGINTKSLVAIFGTLFGIITASFLSWFFGKLCNLSGINMENGEQVLYLAQDYRIKIKGLMFISILIASLGAVMDVSMSIASSANELFVHNENMSNKALFKSLMNIGKDIMGTMTNTLILAFVGSSMTLIMMIWGYQMSYEQFINIPMIAIEAIQSLAGSIGIVLTVPFTSLMAVILIKYKRRNRNESKKNASNKNIA